MLKRTSVYPDSNSCDVGRRRIVEPVCIGAKLGLPEDVGSIACLFRGGGDNNSSAGRASGFRCS